MYSRVATSPDGEFHFHRGPHYAATMLGYDATELAALPADVTSSFAGIGNPHAIGRIPAGATVLDIGCGAGTDLLLAARRVGPDRSRDWRRHDRGDASTREQGRGGLRPRQRGCPRLATRHGCRSTIEASTS